eukprot:SAG31_NODE_178_length_21247_cov_11.492009_21_plen_65_part_00
MEIEYKRGARARAPPPCHASARTLDFLIKYSWWSYYEIPIYPATRSSGARGVRLILNLRHRLAG